MSHIYKSDRLRCGRVRCRAPCTSAITDARSLTALMYTLVPARADTAQLGRPQHGALLSPSAPPPFVLRGMGCSHPGPQYATQRQQTPTYAVSSCPTLGSRPRSKSVHGRQRSPAAAVPTQPCWNWQAGHAFVCSDPSTCLPVLSLTRRRGVARA